MSVVETVYEKKCPCASGSIARSGLLATDFEIIQTRIHTISLPLNSHAPVCLQCHEPWKVKDAS
jgi:hypothetical protein